MPRASLVSEIFHTVPPKGGIQGMYYISHLMMRRKNAIATAPQLQGLTVRKRTLAGVWEKRASSDFDQFCTHLFTGPGAQEEVSIQRLVDVQDHIAQDLAQRRCQHFDSGR